MTIPDWFTIDPLLGKKTTEVANTSIVHTGRLSRSYSVQVDVLKLKAGIQSYEVEQLPLSAFVSLNFSDIPIIFNPVSTVGIGQAGISNSSSITATLGSDLLRWTNFAVNGTEVANDPIPNDPGAAAQFDYTFNTGLIAEYKGGIVRSGTITLTGVDGATTARGWSLPIQHLISPTASYRPAQNWNNTGWLSFPFQANVSSFTFPHQDTFVLVRWGAATPITPVGGIYTVTIPESDYADAQWSKNLFITLADNPSQVAREITIPVTFSWSDSQTNLVTYVADQYGHATKTEYTYWTYSITTSAGYRTRTATQYEGNRLPDGTVPTWTETGTEQQREDGTRSIGVWSYKWVSPITNSTRSATVTYTFTNTTRTTPLTESGGGTLAFPTMRWIDNNGYTPANGGATGVRMTATVQVGWTGTGVVSQGDARVMWTSVDNGFQIGDPAVGWGVDGLFRRINNTSTSVIAGTASGTAALVGVSWPIPTQTVRQTAGAQVYGGWSNISMVFTQTAFPAAGGSTPSTVTCQRTWTWNGVSGSGSTETTTTRTWSGASTNLGSIISGSVLLVPSLGTTVKAFTTGTVTTATDLASNYITANFTQAANSIVQERVQFTGCSGQYSMYTVYNVYTSGAEAVTRNTQQLVDEQCGYIAPHYQVSAHLVTDWDTVRRIVGADEVLVEFNYGTAPLAVSGYRTHGYWNSSTSDLSWSGKTYPYWWGGAVGATGDNFAWGGPPFLEISYRSSGLARFHTTIEVTDPSAGFLALSARY